MVMIMTSARFRRRLGRQERFMVFDDLEVGGRGGSCLFGYRIGYRIEDDR